jgi:predicted O-methyltransferase YrrM
VELVQGEVLEVLDRLNRPFDLVYVDAEKVQYRHYLDRLLDLMPVGGTMVFDNLLWKGRVADPPEDEDDRVADAVRAFNPYMMIHPQLVAQIVPIGDGVGIATKRSPTMREMGGPF